MRPLAVLGLVLSLLLGAIAATVTTGTMHSRRSEQDRMVQEAVNGETALIANGERQTTTALSLLLVDPAITDLLSGQPPRAAARRTDLTDSGRALAAIQRSAFVPVSAACLDDRSGRQLVCGPTRPQGRLPATAGPRVCRARRRLARGRRQRGVPVARQPALLGCLPGALPLRSSAARARASRHQRLGRQRVQPDRARHAGRRGPAGHRRTGRADVRRRAFRSDHSRPRRTAGHAAGARAAGRVSSRNPRWTATIARWSPPCP